MRDGPAGRLTPAQTNSNSSNAIGRTWPQPGAVRNVGGRQCDHDPARCRLAPKEFRGVAARPRAPTRCPGDGRVLHPHGWEGRTIARFAVIYIHGIIVL